MPIYEYECSSCGTIVSTLVRGYDDPDGLVCESCGSKELRRIISKVSFHLSQGDRINSYRTGSEKDDNFYRDSRNIGLRAEQMLKHAGVEPNDAFKSKLENLRSDPSRVLKE
ncbi:MAG: zinc ribbon domain-containing protein [Syntrophales bacterium]|jgi:putative FmdB family regulatory protein|nr:zinc ribbon domain-containing protein [Syntrophales bacterium]MDY0044201.1 zinc ribbon domain-containing protein [Syntrophales bacterium]